MGDLGCPDPPASHRELRCARCPERPKPAHLRALQRIINVNAKNAVALVARGSAFEAKRLVPRAIDDYTRAIKSSKAPAAYFMRANAYAGRGDLAAAIKDYTAAIAGNKNFAAAYQNRALVHEQLGRTDLAAQPA